MSETIPLLLVGGALGAAWQMNSAVAWTAAAVFSLYVLLLSFINGRWSNRRPDDPPYLSGWIPGLGLALSLSARGEGFLADCARRHGPVFTIYVSGRRMTFVTSPTMLDAIVKDTRHFQYAPVRATFYHQAGGVDASLPGLKGFIEDEAKVFQKFLLDDASAMARRFSTFALPKLESELASAADSGEAVDLFHLAKKLVWYAGTTALCGSDYPIAGDNADALLAAFDFYEAAFPLMAGGAPASMLPTESRNALKAFVDLMTPKEVDGLWTSFLNGIPGITKGRASGSVADALQTSPKQPSPAFAARTVAFLKRGLASDPRRIGSSDLLLVHAAMANTAPALYWTLKNVLQGISDGAPWAADAVAESKGCFPGGKFDPDVSAPTLDACLTESLRLASSPFVTRAAVPDASDRSARVKIPGTRFSVALGEQIVFPARLAMHLNPSLYEGGAPLDAFDPARHLGAGAAEAAKRMAAFGAGQSICPGRRYAGSEIRCLVAAALRSWDFEVVEDGGGRLKPGRWGSGVLPPVQTTKVRITRKM
ncbi:cytochrome P450 [Hyaloraphidium curvatum]|nr:cytochrome P450 [Hyaloraphidium curvatum]